MIKYNNKTINDWYFDSKNVIKVYKNNAVCYYKIVSGGVTPSQEPCFAVVEDISSYQDREFEDVYDKATSKWYKLNNLNQYEQYGVYGEGRNITYYKGKLTIDEGYEFEWDGSQWVNLGEVEGSAKESDFTTSDIDENVITSDLSVIEDGMYGVILPVSLSTQTTSAVALMGSSDDNRLANLSSHTKTSSIGETDIIDYAVWKFYATSSANTYYIQNVGTGKYWGYQNVSSSNALPLVDESSKVPVVLSSFTFNNVTAIGICKGNDPYKDYAINDLYAYHYRYNWFNKLSAAGDLNNSYVIYKVNGFGSKLPSQYTEVEYIHNNTRGASINTGVYLYDATGNTFSVEGKVDITYESGWGDFQTFINAESVSSPYPGFVYRFAQSTTPKLDTSPNGNPTLTEVINADGTRNIKIETTGTTVTHSTPLGLFSSFQGTSFTPYRWSNSKIYNLSVTKNGELVRDFVPAVRKSDEKAGLYDMITRVFYPSANSSYNFIAGDEVSVYPKYYTEMEEPENNLTFATMEEALAYECPYVGMIATIGTDLYKFNANNEWEKLSFTITGVTRASEAFKIKLNNADADATIFQDNGDGTYSFGVVYLDPITDTTSMASGNTNLVKFDFGNADISNLTTIGQNAFKNNSNLTTFEIPDGITTVGQYAFENCNNYIDVKIPESITTIGGNAFYRSSSSTYRRVYITDLSKWCNVYFNGYSANPLFNGNLYLNNSLVTTLTLPSDITQVKRYSFSGCKSIQTLNIPDNITSLGEVGYGGAFYNCSNLSTINWGTGLTRLEQNTFYGTAIRTLNIPNGITSIEGNCFAYCNNLQTVTMPDSVTRISDYAFPYNYNTTSITLSQNLTIIGGGAFYQNRSLRTLTIPSKVTNIYYNAFQYCSGLTSITIEATTPPTLGTNVFNNTNDCPIYVPCASVNAYRTATNWSAYADRIVGFESCTTYDWQTISGEYICEDGNKYEVEKYVRSFDNGTTWEDVTPLQTRKGALIAEGVPECAQKTYTDGTYTYNALQDVTVPKRSVNNNYNLYVPYDFEVNYKYSVEFTPLNFWTESYYGFIVGNGNTSYSQAETEEFHIFKMDNGWGSQFFRFGVILHNYNLGTRGGQGLPGAWTVYENVRAKIETHLVNYAAGNGAAITVENEGYETYTGTSTKTVTSSWSPTYGVKNICLFGTYPSYQNSANMKFHNFAVKTSTDELVYNYVPVERQSDGKLGVFDTVHNIFYLANDNLGLVAGDYVYGE